MNNQELWVRLSKRLYDIETEVKSIAIKVAVLEERSIQNRRLALAILAVIGIVSGSAAGITELLQ